MKYMYALCCIRQTVTNKAPSLMKSTSSKHSLTVIVDNNAEEVQRYMADATKHNPREVSISLHNPREPADTKFIPLTSVRIPLGQSTTFLISVKAREIDESGKQLTEKQRGCRLDEETESLKAFNVYTRIACLLECQMKYAQERCGCTPWHYPLNMINNKVKHSLI